MLRDPHIWSGREAGDDSVAGLAPWRLDSEVKTGLLVAAMVAIAAGTTYLLFGSLVVVLVGAVMLIVATRVRVPAALVMRMQGALPLARWQAPGLYRTVEGLARRAGVASPSLYLLPELDANAMAVGGGRRGGAALAVTEGALVALSTEELEGVLAHEVAHLRNRDLALQWSVSLVTNTLFGLLQVGLLLVAFLFLVGAANLTQLAVLGLIDVAAPLLLMLLQSALSRTREIAADVTAVELTGKPWALASALLKLSRHRARWFGWLARPLAPPALRSHPATAERVQRLRELSHAMAGR